MESASMIEEMVARSRAAQRAIESWTQRQADAAVRAVAKAVYDNAEPLARMAVDETRMGVYEHKVAKNRGKARIIWMSLKNRQKVGVLSRDPVTGVTEVEADGVVAAVTPCTPYRDADVQRNVRFEVPQQHHHRAPSAGEGVRKGGSRSL